MLILRTVGELRRDLEAAAPPGPHGGDAFSAQDALVPACSRGRWRWLWGKGHTASGWRLAASS